MLQFYRPFFLLLTVALGPAAAQHSATLRGTVRDACTGEMLMGATVLILATQQGVATGLDGSFLLRGLAEGAVLV